MKLKAVIVEDEHHSRELLAQLIADYCPDIDLVGMADGVPSGVELIKVTNPDLVFLDIEMKGGTGFDLLEKLQDQRFALIFVTGYDQYAIRAFKYAAVDYLLKPISINDLKKAVEKIVNGSRIMQNRFRFIEEFLSEESPDRLMINNVDKHYIIPFSHIIYLVSDGNYTKFYLDGSPPRLSSYPIKHYEELLPKSIFYRIHKSYIVNTTKIKSYDSGRTGNITLVNGKVLGIAARRKTEFKKMMNTSAK